jgi:hypothetical protein
VLGVCVVNCWYPTRLIPSVESPTLVRNIPHCELFSSQAVKKAAASQHIEVIEQNARRDRTRTL